MKDLELQLTLEHLLGEQKGLVHLVHELEGRCQQLVTDSMGKFESLVGNLVERSVQERLAHCEADLGKTRPAWEALGQEMRSLGRRMADMELKIVQLQTQQGQLQQGMAHTQVGQQHQQQQQQLLHHQAS